MFYRMPASTYNMVNTFWNLNKKAIGGIDKFYYGAHVTRKTVCSMGISSYIYNVDIFYEIINIFFDYINGRIYIKEQ